MRVFLYLSCVFAFASCSQVVAAEKEAPAATTHEPDNRLLVALPMMRVGLGGLFPAYLDNFTYASCGGDLPDLSGLELCAEAIGSNSEKTHAFCAHMSAKALIVAVTCNQEDRIVRRYARLAVRYSLELARDGPRTESENPKTFLVAAVAVANEFLSGSERCVPMRVFSDEMLLAYERFFRAGDYAAARSALGFALRFGRTCLPDDEAKIMDSMYQGLEVLLPN